MQPNTVRRPAVILLLGAALAVPAVLLVARQLDSSSRPRGAAPSVRPGEEPAESDAAGIAPPRVTPAVPNVAAQVELDAGATSETPNAAEPASERRAVGGERVAIRGLVLDARTREPVPQLVLALSDGERHEAELATDADGRFASVVRFDATVLAVEIYDRVAGEWVGEVRELRSADAGEVVFYVTVGPTYTFVSAGPLDPRLRGGDPRVREGLASVLEVDADGLARHWPPRSARLADGTWIVRYERDFGRPGWSELALEIRLAAGNAQNHLVPPQRRVLPAPSGADLGLPSTGPPPDGVLYVGRAPLQSTVGVHPGPLVVEFDQQLTLSGRCVDPEGAGIAGLQVSALRLDAPADRTPEESWTGTTDGAGRFLALPLVAGHYRVVTLSREHVPAEAFFDLRLGHQVLEDLVVEPLARGGDLAGTIHIDGSLQDHVALVRVESRGRFHYDQVQFVDVEAAAATPEGGSATFRFADLPEGEYEVTLVTVPELPTEPRSVRAQPPTEDIAFEVDALVEGAKVGFELFDAVTGERIEEFRALFDLGDRPLPTMRRCRSGLGEWKLSDGGKLRWWIEAAGYRPLAGDERAFPPAGASGDPRLAVLRLEPGYTATLLFKDASPLYSTFFDGAQEDELAIYSCPAIAGAQVLADGEVVATSDELGLAIVSLAEEPSRIEVRHARWRVLESSTLKDGKVSKVRTPTVIWMLP